MPVCSNKYSLKVLKDKRPDDGLYQTETISLKISYSTALYDRAQQNMQLTSA
jgi:hypothetical protein